MKLLPNAKINLGLRVVRKREDGYHDLETIFFPVYGLHDELEINRSKQFAFEQVGIAVDCPAEDNLIMRCYRTMQQRFPQIEPVEIRFRKQIPFGAGLGGGSSDAAHTAIALNQLFDLGLSQAELAAIVRPLGADCPFFVYNTPCYAEGIGDRLTPIRLSLTGLRLVMVKPDCGVSTREAYQGIVRHPEVSGSILHALESHTEFNELLPLLVNDFEQTVFPIHPEIENIKKHLQNAGALYTAMSGSGSTVFGLFENNTEGRTNTRLAAFEEQFAPMILFNDTLGER